ncbi:DUF305 domain-containing protein [Nocardioides sp.]|uniref:DUF305 domain-containing protein n=1 Tax=Nocardioides sp. TaxID=35761 RepID=UPI002ED835C6
MNTKKLAAVVAAALLTLGLSACGGSSDDGSDDNQAEHTAPNGDVFNDADVAFATQMIPHHAQALAMVDLTSGRDLSPEVEKLTEDIRAAQGPEIEQMVDWLTAWDEPVPETMRDHANAEDHGMSGHDMDDSSDMPGMMSDEDMSRLESARGADFQTMWLEMMIEHHEGAIEMAKQELADGTFGPAQELATSIETSQQAEIDHMKNLLGS